MEEMNMSHLKDLAILDKEKQEAIEKNVNENSGDVVDQKDSPDSIQTFKSSIIKLLDKAHAPHKLFFQGSNYTVTMNTTVIHVSFYNDKKEIKKMSYYLDNGECVISGTYFEDNFNIFTTFYQQFSADLNSNKVMVYEPKVD